MVQCQYCKYEAELVNGKVIYPRRPDLAESNFWRCELCGAYVGCHQGTTTPLGTLANAELRKLRSKTHREFDDMWKLGFKSRSQAYIWLASALNIPKERCHVAMMTEEQCERTIAAVENFFERG